MNYEQKYKEALKRAKKLYGEGTITESLAHIFPELKESEDEKIRKTLIDFFSRGAINNSTTCYIPDKDIVSWLEKQGEQKPVVIPKFRIGDTIKNPKNPQLIFHIKKIKNNKYMESDDAWVLIKEADEHYELVEQQPTQQSDKERMKTEIDWLYDSIDICICGLIKARKEKDTELEGKLLSSMESLMPQTLQLLAYISDYLNTQNEQPPAEWSEEDESIMKGILQLCTCADFLGIAPDPISKIRNWLESLRPQKCGYNSYKKE